MEAVLAEGGRRALRGYGGALLGGAVIVAAFFYADALNFARYRDALPTLWALLADSLPPDFSRWRSWGRPLAETLAMSICGTVIATVAAAPLGAIAARGSGHRIAGAAVRLMLNTIRSIPGVVWGVLFVAAVGFGPLPGLLALACHSTGMLGKFYAEIIEHVDPMPGDALRSHGGSRLAVLRFTVLPQILPRIADVTLYRWEHNVRAATVLGVVGAGGIGLELVTAFHLFEYREAMALILVILGVVSLINLIGAWLRGRFLASA
ncbi:phosphonate ABC transporter, permease protein PhnE [Rhodovastum atsumiense]|uniref:Phosphonate ABC transporter, permease protein PhnE n=2 Tax=Rhodovastum atsumiense TaxID=504468 RepID=A0A5M6IZY8_9PROT|nr:phosphonate ABC transporter, permease protein PhnE [Rhodovastum atsumiense]